MQGCQTWPKGLPLRYTPRARLTGAPILSTAEYLDLLALAESRRVHDRAHTNVCSGFTQTYMECVYSNRTDFTAYASSAVEGSLLSGGGNTQPVFPAFSLTGKDAFGKLIVVKASGVLGTTGTPTYTWQVRLGTTQGSSFLSGTSVGVSAAITTASGVTNKYWELELRLVVNTPGMGTGNCTLSGAGYIESPGGFASPFTYALEPTTPDTATWTSTVDGGLAQYLNLSVTSSASSSSNAVTCKQLLVYVS